MSNTKQLSIDLINAVIERDTKKVSELLKDGADVNYRDTQGTPLYYAVTTKSSMKIIELLLENGAKTNVKDMYGDSLMNIVKDKSLKINKKIIELLKKFSNSSSRRSSSRNRSNNRTRRA